jgi:hypothetical protein
MFAISYSICHCEPRSGEVISKVLGNCFGAKNAPRNDRMQLDFPNRRDIDRKPVFPIHAQ